jgi:glycyl-tRNA synthetase
MLGCHRREAGQAITRAITLHRRWNSMLTLQEAILRLNQYWAEQGCVLGQPSNTEVGAGTLNPATLLRVLGPEPWRVGYVEPSVRPDDARYGENPNRMQTHTQYQVILKPSPDDVQELYLGSLRTLGIDTDAHDVRFVEDNWESPAVGAWGLGWEVWLDGLEITQFTYFQQAGGVTLDPPSVEITYGMERILMAAQGVSHFKDITFTPGISYGELVGQAEYEMSVYYLDEADVERNRALFELYDAEAAAMVAKRLPLPAHSYVLKCSHTFNVLDARGAIGTSERARTFARMRELSHDVATLWLERREELGYPLGLTETPAEPAVATVTSAAGGPRTFLLEVGCEELPAADLDAALAQLRERIPALLDELRLEHGPVTVTGTPRRLVVQAAAVAPRQPDRSRTVRGPKLEVAFDADGKPTRAAEGFARSNGLTVEQLGRHTEAKGTWLEAVVEEPGRPAAVVLGEALPGLLGGLAFGRTMRWAPLPVAFSRPVRWLAALLGDDVVPFTWAGLSSGRATRGLRASEAVTSDIASADAYGELLAQLGVVADPAERAAIIEREAARLATEAGGRVPEAALRRLLPEVTNLTEHPRPLLGRFDPSYLELPAEVLTTVLAKHQRCLPVEAADGTLLPFFIAIANGNDIDPAVVTKGNEAVVAARYADAAFFWKHDTGRSLESFRPGLSRLLFQDKLGSMLDRNERVQELAPVIGSWFDLPGDEAKLLDRAAYLAKADLVTSMVVDFSSLAGIMGRRYAQLSGEQPQVADAIFEHWLPRQAGDDLPGTALAAALGVADRLDALVGLSAVGITARGSSDPYGLRRLAAGLVQILIERGIDLDLRKAIDVAADIQPVEVPEATRTAVMDFVLRRLEQMLAERHRRDHVAAVLAARGSSPALAAATLPQVEQLAPSERFQRAGEAYQRAARILAKYDGRAFDESLLKEPAEHELWQALQATRGKIRPEVGIEEFLAASGPLVDAVTRFFDDVLVMDPDEAVRGNRLALLAQVAELPSGVIDFRRLQS